MSTFYLKSRDTRPILEVQLKNPDGTVHDLTGSTAWKLHIYVSATVVVTRDMVKQGLDPAGTLRYTWVAADWDAAALPINLAKVAKSYPMEYEVIGGTSRMTFPNGGYDTLQILGDIGQG